MARRSIVTVTLDNLASLPTSCGSCGYWEKSGPASPEDSSPEPCHHKRDWYEIVLDTWGSCGKLVLQANQALAYCQYGPPDLLPQIHQYHIGPISSDATFLSCLYVPQPYRGHGLGKLLLNAVQKDLIKRGYRAIETFARRAPAKNPSGWSEFYLANGWQIINGSDSLTLFRLDLRASVSWQINFQVVLDSLSIPKANIPIPGRQGG